MKRSNRGDAYLATGSGPRTAASSLRTQAPLDYVPTIGDKSRDNSVMLAVFVAFLLLYGSGHRLDRPSGRFEGLARDLGAAEDTLLRATESLVLRGATSIDEGLGQPGVGGRFFPRFAVGTPLVHAPLYWAGWLLSGGRREVAWQTARVAGLFIGALIPALVYRLARVLGGGPLGATAAALVTGAATILWPYALWVTPHALSALCVTAATVGAVSYRRFPRMQSMVTATAGLAGAVLVRPVNVLLAPILLVHVFADRPRRLLPQVRRMPVFVLPVLGAAAWTVWHNHARFGHWLDFGCGREGFTFPLTTSIPRLLAGRETGLLWFNPPVVVGLGVVAWLLIRRRREALLLAALSATIFLAAASWHNWSGGGAWGPILLLEVVPLLSAPAALALGPRRRSWPAWAGVGCLAGAGVAIQVPVVLARNAQGYFVCWWRGWPWVGAVLIVMAVGAGCLAVRLALRCEREANGR